MTVERPSRPALLVVASALEARAVCAGDSSDGAAVESFLWHPSPIAAGCDIVVSGIGKANAAAATAISLCRVAYEVVLSIGIAGVLPGAGCSLGDAVLGSAAVYADEGLAGPDGFQTCAEMGFPLGPFTGNRIEADSGLVARLTPLVEVVGAIATVSTCSGTDVLAQQVRDRTGAVAECMEGAAVGHICAGWGGANRGGVRSPAFAEIRVISNTTGDRLKQRWDMKRALEVLTEVTRRVVAEVTEGSGMS